MTEAATGEKLQKVLARCGIGSRREMEQLIAEGRVQVNGRAAVIGDRVGPDDRLQVDGRLVRQVAPEERPRRVLIYNKPEGEICTTRDPEGRPSVFARLPRLRNARWIAVGRLDFNTSGLLLFTTDGELANALMHPSTGIDREYLCRVLGEVDADMKRRLREGVLLEDGLARFTDLTDSGGEGANRWFTACLMEGRNREVRRLWESQGVQVSRLKRVRFGPVFLPSVLKQGQYRDLDPEGVAALYRCAGLGPPAPQAVSPQQRTQMQRQQRKNRPAERGQRRRRR